MTIEVRGLPSDAQVFLDGVLTAGLPLRLPRSDRSHVLSLRASGYVERIVEVDGLRDRVIEVVMVPVAPVATAPRPSPPKVQAWSAAPRRGRRRARPIGRREPRESGRSARMA